MRSLSTVKLLVEWARWGESHNISYPSMSPMFGERALKSALFGTGHTPLDIWQVEQAVCRLTFQDRYVIILRYQRHMSFDKIGRRLDLSRFAASRRLEAAEEEVHKQLSKIVASDAHKSVYNASNSITAPEGSTD